MYPLDKIPAIRYNMRMRGFPVSNLKGDFKMKKSVRILAVVMVLLMVTLVFASCGKTLKGTYSAEIAGTGVEMEFEGKDVTITLKFLGAEVGSSTGTYKIEDDQITLTFESDDDKVEAYNGTFDFEEGEDYIKIGTFGKFTKKADK